VFSYYRMCSLTQDTCGVKKAYARSLTIDCVLLLKNVFSYYRMCSLTQDTCGVIKAYASKLLVTRLQVRVKYLFSCRV